MRLRRERQINPVADDVLALTAIVRPILAGVLNSLKTDIVNEVGGVENVKLKMLSRLYKAGDGDIGISFEYAVHEALNNGNSMVVERVNDAINLCRIRTTSPRSILLGFEKSGVVQLIDTANGVLTDESRTLPGGQGQPPKLKRRLKEIAAAFRRPTTRLALPSSISGLWKADLFVGSTETQQWVGTSVKINPQNLEGAAGLRVGIIPTRQGQSDKVRLDSDRGLVICPLAHDFNFMQSFYEAWRIVQAFIAADAKLPKEAILPRPVDREICRILEERREYSTMDVIDALKIFSQPELIETDEQIIEVSEATSTARSSLSMPAMLAPISMNIIT